MSKTLNIVIRVFSGILISIGLLQVVIGYEPLFRANFFVYLFSVISLLLVTFLPQILEKFNLRMSRGIYYTLTITVLLSIVGGYGFKFYHVIPHFDTAVHFMNGFIITVLGFSLIKYIVKADDGANIKVSIVAFLLSMAIGAIWEIFEFLVDITLNKNMQRFQDLVTGQPLIGQVALYDTMIDLIVDLLGAAIALILLIRSQQRTRKFINAFKIEEMVAEGLEV